MSTSVSKPTSVISERADGDRPYLLIGEQEDRLLRTGKQLIAASNLQISVEVWKSNLDLMLEDVRAWCEQRSDKVASCFADVRTDKIVVFFVTAAERFDFDLADQMTDFDRDLLAAGAGWVETLQIPASEVPRFVDPSRAFPVYGFEHADASAAS